MNHDPREIRESLKELLAKDYDPLPQAARRTVKAAIELIATMQADLRRQGLAEYNDEETTND